MGIGNIFTNSGFSSLAMLLVVEHVWRGKQEQLTKLFGNLSTAQKRLIEELSLEFFVYPILIEP